MVEVMVVAATTRAGVARDHGVATRAVGVATRASGAAPLDTATGSVSWHGINKILIMLH